MPFALCNWSIITAENKNKKKTTKKYIEKRLLPGGFHVTTENFFRLRNILQCFYQQIIFITLLQILVKY